LVAVGVCAGAGCLFPSLDDLSGSDVYEGPDVIDVAFPKDGGADANPSDVATTDAGDAAQGRFCDGVIDATFCEDFDEPDADYQSRWNSVDLGGGNTLVLVSDASTSAPNALFAQIPTNNTGGASVWLNLPSSATQYDYAFTVRLTAPYDAGSGLALFNQIEVDSFDASAAYTEYRFSQESSGTHYHTHVYYADGGNIVSDLPLGVNFVPGQWYHVDVQLAVSPAPAKVAVYVDGTLELSATIPAATNGAGPSEFLAGLAHTYTPTGTVAIEVDDVVMRVK
jgi:hypothetical protein